MSESLEAIPDGSDVIIDANIFIYGLSAQSAQLCTGSLGRTTSASTWIGTSTRGVRIRNGFQVSITFCVMRYDAAAEKAAAESVNETLVLTAMIDHQCADCVERRRLGDALRDLKSGNESA